MKPSKHLDKVLGRIDDLDTQNLTILVQRLAQERQLLETVFNAIGEGILVTDEAGTIEYANHAASKMIGLRDDAIGKATLWRLVPELAGSFQGVGESRQRDSMTCELSLEYPKPRDIRLHVSAFEDPRQERRLAVILNDVTVEKRSTERIIESEKVSSITMLAAGVAHELGNPLNSINIHLQLIARKLKQLETQSNTESLENSVSVCQGEVQRLEEIIHNFLHAIRPQHGKMVEVSLSSALDEVLEVLSGELSNRGISIENTVPADLPAVLGDTNQIKQVFFNVLKNATEAMQGGGQVIIVARTKDDACILEFKDNGEGIEAGDLAHIFEPYYSTKTKGAGLGMMIIHRILRDHGGSVQVHSTPGQGTTVALRFLRASKQVRLLEQ